MSGIALIRVPNDSDEDASEKAIRNLLALSEDAFDDRLVFERKFEDVDGVTAKNIEKRTGGNVASNVLYHFVFQVELALTLIRERDMIDVTLWHAGGFSLVVPLIVSRLLGHEVFVCVIGRAVDGYLNEDYWQKESAKIWKPLLKYGLPTLVGTVETLSFALSTRIIVFSKNITDYLTLRWFTNKIRRVRFNFQELPSVEPINSRTYPIVYLGRICELKGADRLAAAVPTLEESDVLDGPMLFVGDGNMRAELESKLESHNVRFTGWLPRTGALELVADAKLFVLPSRSEGLPKALLESMARGTVPVVSNVGDIPDVILDGENGYLLDDPSSNSLANVLIDALETDQSNKSRNAIETVRNQFSYEASKREFEYLVNNTTEA